MIASLICSWRGCSAGALKVSLEPQLHGLLPTSFLSRTQICLALHAQDWLAYAGCDAEKGKCGQAARLVRQKHQQSNLLWVSSDHVEVTLHMHSDHQHGTKLAAESCSNR